MSTSESQLYSSSRRKLLKIIIAAFKKGRTDQPKETSISWLMFLPFNFVFWIVGQSLRLLIQAESRIYLWRISAQLPGNDRPAKDDRLLVVAVGKRDVGTVVVALVKKEKTGKNYNLCLKLWSFLV